MAEIKGPLIHLTVKILPPSDLDDPPEPIAFLLNLAYELNFFTIWKIIDTKYKRDYRPAGDWMFKKIQDVYGADISLDETLGNVFGGEDRSKCVIHMLQIQSHREITVPKGSLLRPPRGQRTQVQIDEDCQKRAQEARYGATVEELDPDRPVQSGERELGIEEQNRDKDGFRLPARPSKTIEPVTRGRRRKSSLVVEKPADSTQNSYEEHLVGSQLDRQKSSTPRQAVPSPEPYAFTVTTPEPALAATPPSAQPAPSSRPAEITEVKDSQEVDEQDVLLSDPIEDDESAIQQRLTGATQYGTTTPQPLRPQQALNQLTERRLSRGEDPNLSKRPDSVRSRSKTQLGSDEINTVRKQNLSKSWTAQDHDVLTTALARGLSPRIIHENHFPTRTWESVRKKVSTFSKTHAREIAARKRTLSLQTSSIASPRSVQAANPKEPAAPKIPAQIPNSTTTPTTTRRDLSREQVKKQPRSSAKQNPHWSKQDDDLFIKAVKAGQAWKTLHDRHFQNRSDEVVMQRFAEVRYQVEEEEAAAYKAKRLRELSEQGEPSSKPDEKYTQYEDDLLLAARIEKVEMKRIADLYFPLRTYEQIRGHSSTLMHNAKRAVSKRKGRGSVPASQGEGASQESVSTETMTSEIMAMFSPTKRDRIESKRKQIRSDGKQISATRFQDYEKGLRIYKDTRRADEYRDRARKSNALHTQLEDLQRREEDLASQRLAEDISNNNKYKKEYAAWHHQAKQDEAAGLPTQPSPKRPRGSGIGTEIASTQTAQAGKAGKNTTTQQSQQSSTARPRPSRLIDLTQSPEQAKMKRRLSTTVEVHIPAAKKPKTTRDNSKVALPSPQEDCQLVHEQTPGRNKAGREVSSPFVMLMASQRDDKTHLAASQPAPGHLSKNGSFAPDISMSSPIRPREKRTPAPIKKNQQTTLPFARNEERSAIKTPTSGIPCTARNDSVAANIPDHIMISDDDYSDIDEQDLNEFADRSSDLFPSSPPAPKSAKAHPSSAKDNAKVNGERSRNSPSPKVLPSTPAASSRSQVPAAREAAQSSKVKSQDRTDLTAGSLGKSSHEEVLERASSGDSSSSGHAREVSHQAIKSTLEPGSTTSIDAQSQSPKPFDPKAPLLERLRNVLHERNEAAEMFAAIESGRIKLTGIDADDDDNIEEIDPEEVWRSPPTHNGDNDESMDMDDDDLDLEAEFMDMDDARDFLRERSEHYQDFSSEALKQNLRSSPPAINEYRRTGLPDSMTEEQKDRAMAGPPRAPFEETDGHVEEVRYMALPAQSQPQVFSSTPPRPKADSVFLSSDRIKPSPFANMQVDDILRQQADESLRQQIDESVRQQAEQSFREVDESLRAIVQAPEQDDKASTRPPLDPLQRTDGPMPKTALTTKQSNKSEATSQATAKVSKSGSLSNNKKQDRDRDRVRKYSDESATTAKKSGRSALLDARRIAVASTTTAAAMAKIEDGGSVRKNQHKSKKKKEKERQKKSVATAEATGSSSAGGKRGRKGKRW